ncbi:hypothetical protein D0Y65_048538 [Glycine soja]|uniref:DUF659 domain-containing protein n=1 Tax=Glycine soja TaxID=3848 RepID=A0A445FTD4_GLYSO|nr:hypothetical protein D0Y65_048538 [Glycine soja]
MEATQEEDDEEEDGIQEIARLKSGKRPPATSNEASSTASKKRTTNKKGPLDFLFSKEPEESIKFGKTMRQTSVNESYNKASRDRAVQYIARFFFRNGIAFNVAKSKSFKLMIQAIGIYDRKNRTLINFLVNCSLGTQFVRSVDASEYMKTGQKIFDLLDSFVEEIGEKNVIQVVTDNRSNYVLAAVLSNGGNGGTMAVLHGESLKKRHRIAVAWRVYNGGRYSHGGHGGIAEIAGFFVFFFCAVGVGLTRPNLTRYVIQKCNGETQHRTQHATRSDIPHPAATVHSAATTPWPARTTQQRRAPADDPVKATPHRPRTSHPHEGECRGAASVWTSDEWLKSKAAKEPKGKKAADVVLMPSFWNDAVYTLKAMGPLVSVLRLSEDDDFVVEVHKQLLLERGLIHSKKRSRLEHQKLQDLVYVKYNQALLDRFECHDDIDPIALNDIDNSNEWLLGELEGEEAGNDLVFDDDDDLNWLDVAEATGTGEPLQNTRSQTQINKAAAAPAPTNEKGK